MSDKDLKDFGAKAIKEGSNFSIFRNKLKNGEIRDVGFAGQHKRS